MKSQLGKICEYRIGALIIPDYITSALSTLVKRLPPLKEDIQRLAISLKSLNQKRQSPPHPSEENPHLSKRSTRHSLIEPHVLQYGDRESRAYLNLRFCPSYVAVSSVMHHLSKRSPNFAPKSMLDYGTGPGTAIWATNDVFPSLESCTAIDLSESMLALLEQMKEEIKKNQLTGVVENPTSILDNIEKDKQKYPSELKIKLQRYMAMTSTDKHDLVVSAFTLSELNSDAIRLSTIKTLWSNTSDILVLIERGNDAGFKLITTARNYILEQENTNTDPKLQKKHVKHLNIPNSIITSAHVVAPCAHDKPCPLLKTTHFCSFSQRYQLRKEMKRILSAGADLSNSGYAYVILRRGKRPSLHDTETDEHENKTYEYKRIITNPKKRKGHVLLTTCNKNGEIEKLIVAKSHGEVFNDARKSHWHDLWPYKTDADSVFHDESVNDEDNDEEDHDESVNDEDNDEEEYEDDHDEDHVISNKQ